MTESAGYAFSSAPQAVGARGRSKYRSPFGEDYGAPSSSNIMYDKRVFRGNTYNMNLLKQNLTPAQKEEQRIKMEREKKKVEMIKK